MDFLIDIFMELTGKKSHKYIRGFFLSKLTVKCFLRRYHWSGRLYFIITLVVNIGNLNSKCLALSKVCFSDLSCNVIMFINLTRSPGFYLNSTFPSIWTFSDFADCIFCFHASWVWTGLVSNIQTFAFIIFIGKSSCGRHREEKYVKSDRIKLSLFAFSNFWKTYFLKKRRNAPLLLEGEKSETSVFL